jgi:Flp pilus assembly protein TadB
MISFVGYGLPPVDDRRRSDLPPLTRGQRVSFLVFVGVCCGLGVALVFGNVAVVILVWCAVSVLFVAGDLTFTRRRSRRARKAGVRR